MAKFKKKKSEPTQGTKEPGKIESGHDAPAAKEPKSEITPSPPTESPPKDDPPINLAQQGEKDSKLNKLFWMRVAFAVIAGIMATFIFESVEGEERRWSSIAFMIIVFIATIVIAKAMRIPFALSDRKKLVTQGIGSYVFIYLFVWVFSYTLAHLEDSSGSMPFP